MQGIYLAAEKPENSPAQRPARAFFGISVVRDFLSSRMNRPYS
jgi:hypothetical protein